MVIFNNLIVADFSSSFAGTCEECQANNHLRKAAAELHPIPPPDGSFKQFGMDLIGPFKETERGNRYVVVLTDYLTKWPEAEAIPDKKATTIAKFMIKIICRYASIEVIITDQGREFCNKINEEICSKIGIDHRRTSAYHPQSNGLTERYNQTLINTLVKYTNDEQDDWDIYVEPALLAYRTAEHKSTKQTPFFLAFGRKPSLFIEEKFPVGSCSQTLSEDDMLQERVAVAADMTSVHIEAKENIEASQVKQKKYHDRKFEKPSYRIGDQVFIGNSRRVNRKGDKLSRRRKGPHTITAVCGKGTYRLKGFKQLYNTKRLRPYRQRYQTEKKHSKSIPSPVYDNNGEKKAEVRQSSSSPVRKNVGDKKTNENHLRRKARQTKTKKPSQTKKLLQNRLKLTKNKLKGTPSKKQSNSQEDIKIVKTRNIETIRFEPVNEPWKMSRAKALGLELVQDHPCAKDKEIAILQPPTDSVRIRGDGNCYFRTVSHIITGAQSGHKDLRKNVCDVIKRNNRTFSVLGHCDKYAETSLMDNPGQWATEIEIFATASMLATNVCVFCPYGRDSVGNTVYKWVTYEPVPDVKPLKGLSLSTRKIYISNMHEHYTPVYSV